MAGIMFGRSSHKIQIYKLYKEVNKEKSRCLSVFCLGLFLYFYFAKMKEESK